MQDHGKKRRRGLVLAALMAGRPQRDKLVLGAMWSTSPLVVFTFGQGMPDAWSVLVVLSGWLALELSLIHISEPTRPY